MYANCGNLSRSLTIFRKLVKGDTLYWKVLLYAYLKLHCFNCFEALSIFSGITPDQATYYEVHRAGFIDDGETLQTCAEWG